MENDKIEDPEVQLELDRLNNASEKINELENMLSKKRGQYRQTLTESTQKLNVLTKKFGGSIEKARPYFEAVKRAKEAHGNIQAATLNFERAASMHEAAKEMVIVAEQGMSKDKTSLENTAWQEMLNHATIKVNHAERERMCSEAEHQKCAENFKIAELERVRLEKKLKGAIGKSKGYFQMKEQLSRQLEELSKSVQETESNLHSSKDQYSLALKNLERISNDIHRERGTLEKDLGDREQGVGAESSPQLSPSMERGCVATVTEKGTQISENKETDGEVPKTQSPTKTPENKTLSETFSPSKDLPGTFSPSKDLPGTFSPSHHHHMEGKVTGKGMQPGSSDTISSLRSNGSGRSSSSLQEVTRSFNKNCSLSRNSSSGSVKRNELLLNVAALQDLKPKQLI